MTKKIHALALISGGLDSILAAFLIKNQGVQVTGLVFQSLFFDARNAKKSAKSAKIPLKIIDISNEHLKIVEKPQYGYGKNANPCLDCHLLMLKEAKKIMSRKAGSSSGREKYDFLITGDVLGQRPFSQNQASLNLLEKKSGLRNLILRPLSAKLLPPTLPEQKGWVNREKLLAIQGRSRQVQLKLAKKFKLTDFSAPGTSCILTDPQFSQRLFKLLEINPQAGANDIHLLRLGRHFWYPSPKRSDLHRKTRREGQTLKTLTNLIIVGRDHQENLKLRNLAQKGDFILEPQSFPGPLILIRAYSKKPPFPSILNQAKKLLLKYSPKGPASPVRFAKSRRAGRPKKLSSKDFSIISF